MRIVNIGIHRLGHEETKKKQMAKKILYKVTAYHCPRCGGVTDPKKKYCDYCSRNLEIRRKENKPRARILIDCNDYILFDSIKRVETVSTPSLIEISTFDDSRRSFIRGAECENRLSLTFNTGTDRGRELFRLPFSGIHKIRFELLDADLGYKQKCYIGNVKTDTFGADIVLEQTINFIGVDEMTVGKAIPQEVLDEFRCSNCGAPILSRYGACDYCSGWNEVEW